ncbi:hypothetical protein C0989_004815 [Termitomyces sp. Mn162]|nr:hypothetical protein C0989_004815 [Termitomyces sp. Mn162]
MLHPPLRRSPRLGSSPSPSSSPGSSPARKRAHESAHDPEPAACPRTLRPSKRRRLSGPPAPASPPPLPLGSIPMPLRKPGQRTRSPPEPASKRKENSAAVRLVSPSFYFANISKTLRRSPRSVRKQTPISDPAPLRRGSTKPRPAAPLPARRTRQKPFRVHVDAIDDTLPTPSPDDSSSPAIESIPAHIDIPPQPQQCAYEPQSVTEDCPAPVDIDMDMDHLQHQHYSTQGSPQSPLSQEHGRGRAHARQVQQQSRHVRDSFMLWKTACRLRVEYLQSRYTPVTIRDLVAQEADDYFIKHGYPKPWVVARVGGSGGEAEVAESECAGEEGEESDGEDWSDYESELSDEDEYEECEGGGVHARRRVKGYDVGAHGEDVNRALGRDEDALTSSDSSEDDPDAEGDVDPEAYAHDPSFNAELSSVVGRGGAARARVRGGAGAHLETFYVPLVRGGAAAAATAAHALALALAPAAVSAAFVVVLWRPDDAPVP